MNSRSFPAETRAAIAWAKPPRAGVAYILVSVALAALAGSMTGPALPRLLGGLAGGSMARMSAALGAMTILYALMQLFAGPIQGAIADRFGRRPVVVAANFGLAADCAVLAMAPTLAWLFVGRAIGGATAGSMTAAYAYVADVAKPERRAAQFGLLAAAVSAGAAAGPLIGGLLGNVTPSLAFWVAAMLAGAAGVYGLFVLPESLSRELRSPFKWQAAHPVGAVLGITKDYRELSGWQVALFLMSLGHAGIASILVLFVTFRFGWTPAAIGLYSAIIVSNGLVVQAVAVPRVVKALGERGALLAGMTVEVVAVLLAGLTTEGWLYTLAICVLGLGGVAEPARAALMIAAVGPQDRGRLSGAMRAIAALAGVLAPVPFALLFAAVSSRPAHDLLVGAPFFAAAVLLLASQIVVAFTLRGQRDRERSLSGASAGETQNDPVSEESA